jgi:hypothetical protein
VGDRGLGHEELREDVGAERPFELLCRDAADFLLWMLLARVVHQHVEPAESANGAVHRLAAEALVADVTRDEQATPALFLDRALRLLGILVLVQIDDRDVRTFLGEGDRHRFADPAVTAGDDGHSAFQLAAAPLCRVIGYRPGPHLGLDSRLPILVLRGSLLLLGVLFHSSLPPRAHVRAPRLHAIFGASSRGCRRGTMRPCDAGRNTGPAARVPAKSCKPCNELFRFVHRAVSARRKKGLQSRGTSVADSSISIRPIDSWSSEGRR